MNGTRFLSATIVVFLVQLQALSQSQDPPKYEVAAEFTTLGRDAFTGQETDAGFGGRFTYNLNKVFSIESAGYFFPRRCLDCRNNGRVTEGLAGVKAGKRFENWGIFVKARPGVVSFSEGAFNAVQLGSGQEVFFEFRRSRLTNFATDFGGVIEFYPSRRLVTRFDAGDTIIHFTQRTMNGIRFDPLTGTLGVGPVTSRPRTTHSFQFIASVGFRF